MCPQVALVFSTRNKIIYIGYFGEFSFWQYHRRTSHRQPLLDLPIIDPLPDFEALLIKSYGEFKKTFKSLDMGTTMKRYPRFQGANVLCMYENTGQPKGR